VGVVGDIARAIGIKLVPYCEKIISLLLSNLQVSRIQKTAQSTYTVEINYSFTGLDFVDTIVFCVSLLMIDCRTPIWIDLLNHQFFRVLVILLSLCVDTLRNGFQ
jgi:hypothetical protein